MVRQIRDSHEKKEEALENRIRELKVVVKEMVQKNEKLSSAYRFVKFSPRFFKRSFELSARETAIPWLSIREIHALATE